MAAEQNLWKSKYPECLPDFIIGGAMKSGTTSLHAILQAHPDVSIAQEELGFFDMDDMLQHPDFNFYNAEKGVWTSQSMSQHPELLWDWYYSNFKALKTNSKLVGEDSTSYLSSDNAAKRIGIQDKPIKLIFILRHPTKRTVSNYLHKLKSGRALYSLEDTLRYDPYSIIERSLYHKHLTRFYNHIPKERIKIVLFEEFLQDKEACIKDVCEFLNIEFDKLDKAEFNTHSNKTKVPKYIGLQIFRNRLLKNTRNYRYAGFLPIQPASQKRLPWRYKFIDRLHRTLNPHKTDFNFTASPETVRFLDDFFKSELRDIDTLTKKDIYAKWFSN